MTLLRIHRILITSGIVVCLLRPCRRSISTASADGDNGLHDQPPSPPCQGGHYAGAWHVPRPSPGPRLPIHSRLSDCYNRNEAPRTRLR